MLRDGAEQRGGVLVSCALLRRVGASHCEGWHGRSADSPSIERDSKRRPTGAQEDK